MGKVGTWKLGNAEALSTDFIANLTIFGSTSTLMVNAIQGNHNIRALDRLNSAVTKK